MHFVMHFVSPLCQKSPKSDKVLRTERKSQERLRLKLCLRHNLRLSGCSAPDPRCCHQRPGAGSFRKICPCFFRLKVSFLHGFSPCAAPPEPLPVVPPPALD